MKIYKVLRKKYKYVVIAVGQIRSVVVRKKLFKLLKEMNYSLPTIISPLAYVSKYAKIDEGTVIMHHALVNTDAKVGKNCIINTKALIEHDATSKEYITINGFIKSGSVVK